MCHCAAVVRDKPDKSLGGLEACQHTSRRASRAYEKGPELEDGDDSWDSGIAGMGLSGDEIPSGGVRGGRVLRVALKRHNVVLLVSKWLSLPELNIFCFTF